MVAVALLTNAPPWSQPPGLFVRLHTYLTTNVAETVEHSSFPELRPHHYPHVPPDQVLGALETLLRHRPGWQVVGIDRGRRMVQAVVTTPVLHFRDDVLIHVVAASEDDTAVFVRSQSRVGRGDLGANTRHIVELESALASALQTARATAAGPRR